MIDLSFLTEEEQEAIMKVLQRDAVLKRTEEERVRHLPEKIKDDQQLKNMSGQWFYEAKAKRHRDKIHGADIIRASMRKKRLQAAAEQNKDRDNGTKESWVNNINKDGFLPPELASTVEDPEEDVALASPSSNVVHPASTMIDESQESTGKSAGSPAKQRKNPFNSPELPEDYLPQQTKNEPSRNGKTGFFQTSKEGELSESKEKSSTLTISSQKIEKPKQTFSGSEDGSQIKTPVPKARKMMYKSSDLKRDESQSFPRPRTDSLNARGAPRGILKRNSSSSSTDSETVRLQQTFEPKSKAVSPRLTIHERISEKEHSSEDNSANSLEPLKHVRFSAVKEDLPQSPDQIHSREVGEFNVLESDRLKNEAEEAGNVGTVWNDHTPPLDRKPLPFHQSPSSPSASKNETHQPMTFPTSEHHSPSEVLTTRPQSIESSPVISEHKVKSPESLKLESEVPKRPADELSRVGPESCQVPGGSSRDHQQGKPPLLTTPKAKTPLRFGPYATEIRKTTDDSISKVLDWFNRSSHSDDNKLSLHQPEGIDSKENDSKSQLAIAMVTDDTSLKENDSKVLSPTTVELAPVGSDSTFQAEGNKPPSGCIQDNVNNKTESIHLSQQGKGGPGILQPFEIYSPNERSKNMDSSQASKYIVKGNRVFPPTSNHSYRALKENHVPSETNDVGSLGEEPQLHVYEKHTGNSEVNFESSVVKEPSFKDNLKTKRTCKGDTCTLNASLEQENNESPSGATNNSSPWKKSEVPLQQEAGEAPQSQVQREKYKRVSDRISFWEGEKAAAKLTHKDLITSHGQGQPSKGDQPLKTQCVSMEHLSMDQSEDDQVTAKQVVLDEDGPAAHLSGHYSSSKLKDTRPPILGPHKNYPSSEQPVKVPLFQNKINEPIQRLPVAESLHTEGEVTLPELQHPSNIGSEIYAPLEKDRSLIGESKPSFKVMSLKERMDEPNTEQVYNHSQFENLRKFWDLGANLNNKENVEKNTTISQKNSRPFNSQKHKELSDIKSSERDTHEIETCLSQKKVLAKEEMEKFNSKCIPHVLPGETTFPLRTPRKSTHQLPGNESSKENVEKNTKWFETPGFKEEKDYSDQEIQESIVKTSVLSKDYKDTFNDSLQKLLLEVSSSAIQLSSGEVHGQVLAPGVSEYRTRLQKTDFADSDEVARGPKEIIDEHVDKTVAPPKFKPNTLTASLDKLLKEATGTSPSPLQIKLEPLTSRANSEPEENSVFEKEVEGSHSTSACQREIRASFPEGEETLGQTALSQKTEGSECQPNRESLLQMTAGDACPLEPPSHLRRKGSLGDVANSPQDTSSFQYTHLAPQDKSLSSQREISETVEKVILLPKPPLKDVNAALQKLHREAWLTGREVIPGEVKEEFPEIVQATGSPQNYLGDTAPQTTQMSPSVQTLSSSVSTVAQYGKALPQEVAEIVRETVIQPKSDLLEFSTGLERLLKETIETPSSKYESYRETLSPSQLKGSIEVTRQAASEFHAKEIKETVEKSEAPSITECAFEIGFEKLLKEVPQVAAYQPQVPVKEETPEKEPSQSEQARFLGTVTHPYQTTFKASDMKVASSVCKSQANQHDKELGGDKTVTNLLVDPYGSESGIEISGTPEMDYDIRTTETIKPPENRDSKSEIAGVQEREPGFEEAPEVMSVSRSKQPMPLLMNKENPPNPLTSLYKRREKDEDKGFSDSEFSDGNTSSNAEIWRNTSSSEEEPSPVLKTLERRAARKMPSKSLEDISSDSSNQAKVNNLPEELVHSAEDDKKADQEADTNECIPGISTVPSQPDNQFSHPDKLKRMSKSVPAFLQDESDDRETDTASESSYQLSRHKKSPSSLTNLSSYSGMTSLSSVSGSVMSVYSGDFGNLEVKGSIQFAIDYMDPLKELHVLVAQCKDLAAADTKKQRSDPYVKSYLLPDKDKMGKKKTAVAKKTLNPVYNEILRYKIEKQILKTQKLNLSVWHRDTFKRNTFLGEVELDLETWDWENKQNKQLTWYPLKQKTAPVVLEAENRGEMKLALQYIPEPNPGKKFPATGEVHIWVKECLDLPLLRGSHLNSFVKCTILPDTSRKSRQKTRAVGRTTNPVFNHTMVYDGFRPEDLMEACIELTVWDHYKLTSQFLGGLRIGFGTGKSYGTEVDWMDSTSEEVALWEKMVNSPNTWIEATLPLRMLQIAKISK
ncbi:synaptotagmin-like protein 2 isoform X2 [Talpa occidentalis]|uniref:synaptotagmin-like protein 2 isoform X2 n=1 Tax=Talpa occidentalis TaxID=50954 RepID=UPI0018902D48|nr:synaptotagmin-like protein 2 isoform X2 [Talpa occidentalis]